MNYECVEEDNIKSLLTNHSNWIATTAIPLKNYGGLHVNITLKLNTRTLKNYLRKVVLMLKDKFSEHCAWEEPNWITRMSVYYFEMKRKGDQGKVNVGASEDTKRGL